jgi:hypothetical protein
VDATLNATIRHGADELIATLSRIGGMAAPSAITATSEWWLHAACVGLEPSWWFESRAMWDVAVQRCIICPVRRQCLDDAIRHGDVGVIRGASWLVKGKRGRQAISLICKACGTRPVIYTRSTVGRFCTTCDKYR